MMRRYSSLTLFGLLLICHSMVAQAELYQCKTGRGTVNYTNVPCADQESAAPKASNRPAQGALTLQDPDVLMREHQRAVMAAAVAPSPVAVAAPVQDSYSPAPQTRPVHDPNTQAFTATTYHEGMSWLLQAKGFFPHFERYEIISIENNVITCRRTLLNARKQAFAGGISEDFTIDLRQQMELSATSQALTIAGYVFDTQQHQGEQSVSWHIRSLPLITPLIRYRNGDETILVEIQL